jgi:hypothetical protein
MRPSKHRILVGALAVAAALVVVGACAGGDDGESRPAAPPDAAAGADTAPGEGSDAVDAVG